jgi:hypothetical protein
MNKFIIGSGYWHQDGMSEAASNFHKIWLNNISKYTDSPIYVVCVGGCRPNFNDEREILITLNGNCGHVGALINGTKNYPIGGWSASICLLAMLAYNNESSFVYAEQDCLWFGGVPERMYQDLGDKGMVFGAKMGAAPWMSCAQSTFLIRHSFILDFLRGYLFLPHDKDMLPEDKFVKLEENSPNNYGRISFGVDRERPMPWDAEVWYAQQWTQEELDEAKKRGLL